MTPSIRQSPLRVLFRAVAVAVCVLMTVADLPSPSSVHAQEHQVTATRDATGDAPPERPTDLQASAEHDSVSLTWTASTDAAVTHYAVLRRDRNEDDAGVFDVIDSFAGPGLSYTDDSVSPEGSYVYRVKAVSPTGVSQWSSYARADTPAAPTSTPEPTPDSDPEDLAPSGLSVEVVSGDEGVIEAVVLAWDAPAEDAASVTGYEILRAVGDGDLATLVADTGSAGTTHTDDTATEAGESYAYRVKALRGQEASQPSDRAVAVIPKTTPAEPEPPITARQDADTTVTLVTNLEVPDPSSGVRIADRRQLATAFTTGSHSYGYAIDNVTLRLNRPSSLSTDSALALTIRADNNGDPGETLITLTQESGSVSTGPVSVGFTPDDDAILDPDTTYFLVAAPDEGELRVYHAVENGQTSGSGWSIADGSRYASAGTNWDDREYSIRMEIDGSALPDPTPATLDGLSLSDVTLSPVFAAGTLTYTASVARAVTSTTVTATLHDDAAEVVIKPDDADPDTDGHQVALAVGDTTVSVTVTAADDSVAQTYTVALSISAPVPTTWSLVPSGLVDGDSFRLLFIGSNGRDASSSDIAVYNTFIQNLAAAGHADIRAHSAIFRVLGSTEAVDARDNTGTRGTGVPIYWLGGSKVADDYADFYDGAWDEEATGARETGASVSIGNNWKIWTGSAHDGTEAMSSGGTSRALGNAGGHWVMQGSPNGSNSAHGPIASDTENRNTNSGLYGLSGVFTVDASLDAQPEQLARTEVPADWGLIPGGLGPGDRFRLIFVSSNKRDGSSTDIAVYNTFVQTAAAGGHTDIQGHSSTFRVVGSTADVDARDNTATTYTNADKGVAIYWLGGAKVADDYEDFYDEEWENEANSKDQSGADRSETTIANWPITGSGHDGTERFEGATSRALGADDVQVGRLNSAFAGGPLNSISTAPKSATRPLYGLSGVFVVGAASTDATLSALSLSVVTLSPSFAADTLAYTASVHSAVDSTTVTATANDDGATIAILPADSDDTIAGHQVALAVGITAVSVTVTAEDGTTMQTYAVTVTRAEPPAPIVIAVTVTSLPGLDETYAIGDTIEVAVVFNALVTVTGTPRIRLRVGGGQSEHFRWADYSYVVGPEALAFSYTVQAGDMDTNGIFIEADELELNGGTIQSADGINAELAYTQLGTQAGHKVDGVRPTPELAATSDDGASIIILFSEPLAATTAPASAFTLAVDTGTAPAVSSATASGDRVTLALANALTSDQAATVTVTYADPTSGDDSAAVQDPAGNDAEDFTTGSAEIPDVANAIGAGCSIADGCYVVPAEWGLIPDSLGAGDRFRLLFLSSTTRNATSADIDVYNTWIQDRAAAGHTDIQDYSSIFRVVGSTAAVDARDNTATTYTDADKGVAIYWLGGAKVADDYEDFYDGGWENEDDAKDESGSSRNTSGVANHPFTGSNHDGTESTNVLAESRALGAGTVRIGQPDAADLATGPLSSNSALSAATSHPLYGLSAVFRVEGQTTTTNAAPEFANDTDVRTVPENSPAGTSVGDPVTATDDDGDTLTYTLEGDDALSFGIDSSSGQIQTIAGVTYDHETTSSYSVTVKADDGKEGTDTIIISIGLTDVDEPPSVPDAPTVSPVTGSSDSLSVTWTAPDNTGKPDIESYDLQYRQGTTGDWTDGPQDETDPEAIITGLDADTEYQVQVRATNDEGDGDWSASGTGSTVSQADDLADTEVPADWGLIPSSLGGGDRFRLLFRTSGTRDATSSNIADYNTFVQTAAAGGHTDIRSHSSTFNVLGSTADTDARDNTSTTYTDADKGVAIYWLDGAKVADNYQDFYDGSWSNADGGKDENGDDRPNPMVGSFQAGTFTGSKADGTEDSGHTLGTTRVTLGQPLGSNIVESSSNAWAFYGLSGVFVVGAASTDATLSALSLSGVTLSPAFAADTLAYTASVDNAVDSTTVTATANDAGAMVAILPVDDDATGGHQVSLAVGDTTVSVTVTAADGTTTQTYAVTVNRAEADTEVPSNWGLIPTGLSLGDRFRLIFVSEGTRDGSSTDIDVYNTWIQTQVTGGHAAIRDYSSIFRVVGSTAAVDARDNTATRYTGDETAAPDDDSDLGVAIYWLGGAKVADNYKDFYDESWDDEANAKDESGSVRSTPGTGQAPLTGSDHDGTEAFTDTTSNALGVDNARPGWLDSNVPGTGPLNSRSRATITNPRPFYGLSGVFVVSADAASTDATLSALSLSGVTLSPVFAADRLEYTASVGNAVDSTTVTATANDPDAVVAILPDAADDTTDGHQVALAVGDTTVSVTVTAAERTTTQTYEVTVTRAAPPTVASVVVTSTPSAAADTYGGDETIEVTVTFDQVVTVTGTPRIQLRIGGGNPQHLKWADYVSGSGDEALVFAYTVQAGDQDDNGIFIEENELELNGGTIQSADGTDAVLTYTRQGAQSGHKVDGSGCLALPEGRLWSACLTAGEIDSGGRYGYESPSVGSLAPATFDIGATTYTVTRLFDNDQLGGSTFVRISLMPVLSEADADGLKLHLGDDISLSFTDAAYEAGSNFSRHDWSRSAALGWSAGQKIVVGITQESTPPPVTNAEPSFTSADNFTVDENQTAVGTVIATDADAGDTVTYAVTGGDDLAHFHIDATSGVLTFATAPDHENPTDDGTNNVYLVTVTATGGTGGRVLTTAQDITVTVTDVDEPPAAPEAPTFTPVPDSTTSLSVSWTAPDNTGKPGIESYDLRYRQGTSGDWTDGPQDVTGLSATITGLEAGTSYQVQVRATNDEGEGDWSATAEGSTNAQPEQLADTEVPDDWGLIPSGLGAGDRFRLIFISEGTRNARATDIADYNTWIQTQVSSGHADIQGHSSIFRVVGSTAAVYARDNTATRYTGDDTAATDDDSDLGVAIYWLDGNKVADQYRDFYDGGWDDEANAKDESGDDRSIAADIGNPNLPFTGSEHDGTEEFSGSVSLALGAASHVRVGQPNSPIAGSGPLSSNNNQLSKGSSQPFYGLSGVFVVGGVASTDATLSTLSLSDSSLSPSFAMDTLTYQGSVRHVVTRTTVTATPNDNLATVAITSTGAGGTTDGHQVELAPGVTTVSVVVTAEDGTTTQTYTVTVTRAAAEELEDTEVPADWGLKPSDLSPGDRFRLIFISEGTRDATATAIADYDAWIQHQVSSGHDDIQQHSSTFRVVGSTAVVDARDNTATRYTGDETPETDDDSDLGVAIYWLDGSKVADDYRGFYDGGWDDEANAKDESGNDRDIFVSPGFINLPFTGSEHDGTEAFDGDKSQALGASTDRAVRIGQLNSSASEDGPLSAGRSAKTLSQPFYGLSEVFVVGAASTDATLSTLSLSGVTLSPNFAADTLAYTASVGSAVDSTTVTATANDAGAVVAITPADADAATDGHQVSLGVGDTTVSVTVTAADGTTTQTYAVTVTRAAAPAVDSVAVSSFPGPGATYAIGETIRVTVVFTADVTVTGTPRILLHVGGNDPEHLKWADYTVPVAAEALLFAYTVQAGDEDTDGIFIAADKLELNGGTIQSTDGTDGTDAELAYTEPGTQSGHKVDGVRPTFVSAETSVDGTTVSVTFSESLSLANAAGFQVSRFGGSDSSVSSATIDANDDSVVTLTLTPALSHDDILTLDIARNTVKDAAGNDNDHQSRIISNNVPTPNAAPEFAAATDVRTVPENSPPGTSVGAPVTATDDDGETLTYTLEGTDAASFDIDASTGQIQTIAGVTYDHEAKSSYSVTVKADDTNGGTDTIAVTIDVTDVNEPPSAPAAPAVTPVTGSSDSLSVTWTAPDNSGKPDIESYDLRYRKGTTGDWTDGPQDETGLSATITGLDASTMYQVQVRATNDEGDSDWSVATEGSTNAQSEELAVTVTADPTTVNGGGMVQLSSTVTGASGAVIYDWSAATGTFSNASIHNPVWTAPDALDTDELKVLSLTVVDSAASEIAGVRVTVRRNQAPEVSASANPASVAGGGTVTLDGTASDPEGDTLAYAWTSDGGGSFADAGALDTTWTAPAATDAAQTIMLTLTATDDGAGTRSATHTVTVTVEGVVPPTNAAPVFTSAATFSADENQAAVGTVIATDADAGDTVTYAVTGGADQAHFQIDMASGMLVFTTAPDHENPTDADTNNVYLVTVTATGGTGGRARTTDQAISVTVNDVDEEPAIASVSVVSDPGADDTYGLGDTIEVQVVFDQAVIVTGAPSIEFEAGGNQPEHLKLATYADGSGTATLRFDYVVQAADMDDNGIWLKADKLELNGGTIQGVDDDVAANLGYASLGRQDDHKIDGSPSMPVPVETISVPTTWSLVPGGLGDGDSFRLLFIGSSSSDASSSDIAVYNTFIQNLAAAGHADIQAHSATFRMLGSTEAVDARDNTGTTGTGVPIYWLGGAKVADDYADLYDGAWDEEATGARETGESVSIGTDWKIWTGSAQDGTEAFHTNNTSRALGNAGNNWVMQGSPNGSDSAHGPIASNTANRNTDRGLYGLSGVFTVDASLDAVNTPPTFLLESTTREVEENSPAGTNVGDPVTATDADADTLTYTLEGTDAASFEIDSTSGQIQTKSGVTYDYETKSSYSVTVRADDGNGGTATIAVAIDLLDADETVATPGAPQNVEATAGTGKVRLTWDAPASEDGGAVTHYEYQRKEGTGSFGSWTTAETVAFGSHSNSAILRDATTLDHYDVKAETTYTYRVRAVNAGGYGTASAEDSATTGAAMTVSIEASPQKVMEDEGPVTVTVVAELPATRPNTEKYELEFRVDVGTISVTASSPDYGGVVGFPVFGPDDFRMESGSWVAEERYTVTIVDDDIAELDETFRAEVGSAMAFPHHPFITFPTDTDDVTVTILNDDHKPVVPTEEFDVLVGETNAGLLPDEDEDGDTLTWTLTGGADQGKFTLSTNGQLSLMTARTSLESPGDNNNDGVFELTVQVSDGHHTAVSGDITVRLIDVAEPPRRPGAPWVRALDGSTDALDVRWPEIEGDAVRSYDLRYREGSGGDWTNGPQDVTGNRATISGLESGTSYEVQLRATNSKGDGDWSPQTSAGTGTDNDVDGIYAYWTKTLGSEELHEDIAVIDGVDQSSMLVNDCNTTESFRMYWIPAGVADQWAAEAFTDGGAGDVSFTVHNTNANPLLPELTGTARLDGVSRVLVRVRGRFGEDWANWSRVAEVMCLPPESGEPETGRQNVEEDEDEESTAPLTARFLHEEPLGYHSGAGTTLTVRLSFSEAVSITPEALEQVLEVTHATVEAVSRVDGRSDLWKVRLTPHSDRMVTVLLPLAADCDATGAVCTADGGTLSIGVGTVIPGPPPNSTATGAPTIGGAAEVGQVLSADVEPGRPQDLEGNASAQGIALTWNAPVGSAVTSYVIYRAVLDQGQLHGKPMTRHATIDATGAAMAYIDAEAEAGVEYRYRVAAVNSAGEGKKSNWINIFAEDS